MKVNIPEVLSNHILPISWDVRKVWGVIAPIEKLPITDFNFLLDLPFWSSKANIGMLFDLTPKQVIKNMDKYPHQKGRILKADIRFPIDFIFDRGNGLLQRIGQSAQSRALWWNS
ncbi:MAG: hypothetical protein ACQETH_14995 [Candidatus Rifleibacteriota bacterium]